MSLTGVACNVHGRAVSGWDGKKPTLPPEGHDGYLASAFHGFAGMALGTFPTDARVVHVGAEFAEQLVNSAGLDTNARSVYALMFKAKRLASGDVRACFHTSNLLDAGIPTADSVFVRMHVQEGVSLGGRVLIVLRNLGLSTIHFGSMSVCPPASVAAYGISVPAAYLSSVVVEMSSKLVSLTGWIHYGDVSLKDGSVSDEVLQGLSNVSCAFINGAVTGTARYLSHPFGLSVRAFKWSVKAPAVLSVVSSYLCYGFVVIRSRVPIPIVIWAADVPDNFEACAVVDDDAVLRLLHVVRGSVVHQGGILSARSFNHRL